MTSPPSAGRRPLPDGSPSLASWFERRTFDGARYRVDELLALKRETLSVILPAREVARTIEAVLEALLPLAGAGLIDELLVVDAASRDGSAEIAARLGATVVQESELWPQLGPARGKGDAMWRGLAATTGDVVAYLDADTENFDARFLLGLVGPLLEQPGLELVKGAFRRPRDGGGGGEPEGGGRVTELVARPLISLHFPELAGFAQPLAGEVAARRALLESLAYPVGYGVELAMLIDAARRVGVEALAQSRLGARRHRHQPLRSLSAMAYAVLAAGLARAPSHAPEAQPPPLVLADDRGLERRHVPVEERPPLRRLKAVTPEPRGAAETTEGMAGAGGGRSQDRARRSRRRSAR